MVGDELSEKMLVYSFRTSGNLTGKMLKAFFKAVKKKGAKIINERTPNEIKMDRLSQDGNIQVQGMEVSKEQLAGFDQYAKRYGLEYSLIQEQNDPNHYFFVFRAKDISKVEMAAEDFLKDKTIDRGDLNERFEKAREQAIQFNKAQEKGKSHTKTRGRPKDVTR